MASTEPMDDAASARSLVPLLPVLEVTSKPEHHDISSPRASSRSQVAASPRASPRSQGAASAGGGRALRAQSSDPYPVAMSHRGIVEVRSPPRSHVSVITPRSEGGESASKSPRLEDGRRGSSAVAQEVLSLPGLKSVPVSSEGL